MPKPNEATSTDLKVIERLQQLGWKQVERISCENIGIIYKQNAKVK
jgi:hypothetical protein